MHLYSLQLKASWRYFARHPGQLALALLGLALGVAAVVSVGAARATISESFSRFSDQLTGSASHQITGADDFFDGGAFVALQRRFAGLVMAPVLSFEVKDASNNRRTVLGVDLLREARLRDFTGSYAGEAGFPLADWLGGEPLVLAGEPVGSEVRLAPPADAAALTVAARLDPSLVSGAEELLIVDLSQAASLLAMTRGSAAENLPPLPLSRIDLAFDDADETLLEAQLAELRAALPANLTLRAVGNSSNAGMSRALELNLLALSLLALLVGAFIVFNTLRFFVLQRQQVYAFCRLLGLTRRDITRWILLEACLLGVLGTGLGMLLGLWLADVVMAQMAGTVSQLYYEVVSRSARISPLLWAQAAVLGLLGSLAAALWPALTAARQSPLTQARSTERTAASSRLAWQLVTLGMFALALALLLQLNASLISALAAVFLVAVGWIAIAIPLAVRLLGSLPVGVARRPLAGFARARLPQTLSRTGAALAALILAVATVIGVDHMISSFRGSVVGWLNVSLSADAYLRNGADNASINPEVLRRVRSSDGVREVARYVSRSWPEEAGVSRLSAQDLTAEGRDSYEFMTPWSGEDWRRWQREPVALISETLARRMSLQPADRISVPGPAGPVQLEVGAVFKDYRADGGRAIIHLDQYQQIWSDLDVTSAAVYFEPGQAEAGFVRLRETLAQSDSPAFADLELGETGEIRRRSLEVFDQTFQLTRGLKWLAAIVAFVGVLSAILALQLERRRESSLLHCLGLTRRQIGTLLLLESIGLGLTAALLAAPLGAALAWLLTGVVNTRAFGWTLYVDWQWATFALGGGLALVAAVLAALPPALSFNRPAVPRS